MHQNFFWLGLCPGPCWESLLDAPPEPVVGSGGGALSLFPSPRRLRPLDLGAFGASLLTHLQFQYKFLGARLHATSLSKNSGYATVLVQFETMEHWAFLKMVAPTRRITRVATRDQFLINNQIQQRLPTVPMH